MLSALSRRFCLGLLTAGVGYAVFENGGQPVIPWNTCLLAVGLVAIIYWVRASPASDLAPPMELRLAGGLLLLVGYVALQLLPLPLSLLKILSPAGDQVVESLGAVMRRPQFAPISVIPSTTFSYFLRIVGYALIFLTVRDMASRSSQPRPRVLALPLIGLAGLEAAWAMLQPESGSPAAGTYVNRNHFAGLLEMVLPLALMYALILLARRDLNPRGSGFRILKGGGMACVALLLFCALLRSNSKMGFISCLGALFVMAALALGSAVHGWKRLAAVAGLIGLFLCAFIVVP